MKKFLLYLIPSLFVLASFLMMIGGGWLKGPFGDDDDLLSYVEKIEIYVKSEKWEEAQQEQWKAENAWERISKRVQYSVERDDMMAIAEALHRIKGGIEVQDATTVFPDIYYFYGIWNDFG
ncbi:DUF4363 family protein [Alkalihalophilus lindianensis]|uniref:DUF4363 family protein n=2 Tax=Bacillaceae TaxID=186817 RepID=A0ABU3XDT2_9BACI|nr:DUF4363 family protein [Alkalihalophilus lindianensis]MDV2686050.1 DUF4363 family protein [Alkalihalophilus lindianensis]